MKWNAIATVGVALVDVPLAVEPHLLYRIRRAEVEGSAGAALASLAVAQVHPIRFTCGNYSKRAAVALPDPFHYSPPVSANASLADLFRCRRAASTKGVDAHIRKISLGRHPVTLGCRFRKEPSRHDDFPAAYWENVSRTFLKAHVLSFSPLTLVGIPTAP